MAQTINITSTARLSTPLLFALRVLWAALVVVVIATSAYGLSEKVQLRQTICDGEACPSLTTPAEFESEINDVGFSLQFLTFWETAFFALCVIVFLASGAFFLLRGSDDLLALVVAFTFVGASSAWPLTEWEPTALLWISALQLIRIMSVTGFMFFLVIFPSRRFVPGWMRWYVPLASAANAVFLFLPRSPSFGLVGFLAFLIPLGSQVYRYRNISTAEEKQQVKWILVAWLATVVISIFHLSVVPALGAIGLLLDMLVFIPLGTVSLLLVPVAVLIAIQKYQLWNINFIINRSLVYGILTVIIGLVFTGGFFALRMLIRGLFGIDQDLVAATIPAAIGVALFRPTRERLKHFVDRRFYGIQLNYTDAGRKPDQGAPPRSPTTRIGEYQDLTLIGSGGMGDVYRAYDPAQDRNVAIKVLSARLGGDQTIEQRFLREARATAALSHPNIVKVYEVGADQGQPYIVMEYIDGQDLSQLIKTRGKLSLIEALPRLKDIVGALDYAHEQGIIHRDIKPSNIMIETNRAVLMDFGIAKISSALTALTGSGQMVGTLDYIAPEQIQGAAEVDLRADIYALGIMTYQILTGELPFKKNNPGALVLAHLMEPAPDACLINRDLSDSACAALLQAMAKKSDERFSTAGAFVDGLASSM